MITESICLRQEKDLVDNRTSLCSSIPLSLEGRYALLDKEWRKRYFYSDVIIGFTYNHDTLPSNCAQCPPDYIRVFSRDSDLRTWFSVHPFVRNVTIIKIHHQ